MTDAVCARFLTDYQNALIAKAALRDPQFLAQTVVVSLALNGARSGVGVGPGQPGESAGGQFTTTDASSGSLIELGVTSDEGAAILVSETPVTSATPTSLTKTGANRTTNADQGKVLRITAGLGVDQRRTVLSNSATQWVISTGTDGLQWETPPDGTSLFELIDPVMQSDDTAGVVTALPSTTTNQGYLVKLDATGLPYIDYSQPLTATMEQGVPLPSMHAVLPALSQVWYATDTEPGRLTVTSSDQRFVPHRDPAVFVIGTTLYLCGRSTDWADVKSIELRYVPIAPAFAALTDVFLIPDQARAALVAKLGEFMAMRVAGMEGVTIDPMPYVATAQGAELDFLRTVSLNKRGRLQRVRAIW